MRTLLLVVCLLLPSAASADDLVRELEVQRDGSLRIELEGGNVDVFTHDGDRVRVAAHARGVGASGVRFLVSEDGDELRLSSVLQPWLSWLRTGPRVHVEVWAPRSLRLEIETAGSIVTHDAGVERSFPARGALASN